MNNTLQNLYEIFSNSYKKYISSVVIEMTNNRLQVSDVTNNTATKEIATFTFK